MLGWVRLLVPGFAGAFLLRAAGAAVPATVFERLALLAVAVSGAGVSAGTQGSFPCWVPFPGGPIGPRAAAPTGVGEREV